MVQRVIKQWCSAVQHVSSNGAACYAATVQRVMQQWCSVLCSNGAARVSSDNSCAQAGLPIDSVDANQRTALHLALANLSLGPVRCSCLCSVLEGAVCVAGSNVDTIRRRSKCAGAETDSESERVRRTQTGSKR